MISYTQKSHTPSRRRIILLLSVFIGWLIVTVSVGGFLVANKRGSGLDALGKTESEVLLSLQRGATTITGASTSSDPDETTNNETTTSNSANPNTQLSNTQTGENNQPVDIGGGDTPNQPDPDPVPTPENTWHGYVKPGPSNTGPTNDSILIATSGGTIDDAWLAANNGGSRVIENRHFTGQLTVEADNVTIRNFIIDANGSSYGVYNDVFTGSPSTGLVLEDGEIINSSSSGLVVSNTIARRLQIHESGGDAIKPFSNVVIESSWYYNLGTASGAHADGVQMVSGSNNAFRGNFCDMPVNEKGGPGDPYKSNACFIIQTNNGPIDDISIEANWLNGGNYTIYVKDKGNGHGLPTNVSMTNNRIGRDYRFGTTNFDGPVTQSGNVWDDTEEPF